MKNLPEQRYQRNIGTIGIKGQKRLLAAKVAVVGLGGLGGTVVELLARAGFGYLRIIDGDIFTEQNLNRQLLCTESNIGEKKVAAAVMRIKEVNSSVEVDAFDIMINQTNAEKILKGVDCVVDALDSFSARLIVEQASKTLKIPMVHAAIAGFSGYVTVITPDGRGLRAIFGDLSGPDKGIETELGNPPPTPAFAAALQVQEVIKLITGVGVPLAGKVLCFDLETNLFETVKLQD